MADALRGGAGGRRGSAAAAADRAAAQGALPGRQRRRCSTGRWPGSPGWAWPGRPTVAVNAALPRPTQVVAHVGDRAHLSVEPDGPLGTSGGVGQPAGLDRRAGRAGRQRRRLPGRPGSASPARTSPRCSTAGTARPYGCSASPPPTRRAGRLQRPPVRRLLAAAVALRPRPHRRSRPSWSARCGAPPRRPASWRWSPTTASTSTPAPRPTTWRPTCTRPAAATWSTRRRRSPAAATESVVGAGAAVAGDVTRCVVWPGATVRAGERCGRRSAPART